MVDAAINIMNVSTVVATAWEITEGQHVIKSMKLVNVRMVVGRKWFE